MLHIPDDKARRKAEKRKARLGKIVRPPKASEMELRRRMGELWQLVLQPTADRILEMSRQRASVAEIAAEIERALYVANTQYASVADEIVWKWVAGVNKETRIRMQAGLREAMGVDMAFLLDNSAVQDMLTAGSLEAASLIRTIPEEYLGKVAKAVFDNFTGRPLPTGSLTNEILALGARTKRRAELIARDQTSKLTGKLNQVRQQSIGVTEYVWRTSQDQRVAGNPSGKYPDADKNSTFHGDHYHRNGKRFKWSEPPPDGHPGEPGFCRCHAQPVIDPKKVIAFAEGRDI